MSLEMIVAMSQNRVIGNKGFLPWHIPEDLRYFKETTMGKDVIVGSTTYETIPKPLPGRRIIVLTSKIPAFESDTTIVYNNIEDILKYHPDGIVAGGGSIYEQFMPFVNTLYLTTIHKDVDGDTYFVHDERLWTKKTRMLYVTDSGIKITNDALVRLEPV